MKVQDMLCTENGVLLVSKVEEAGEQHRTEQLEDEERERTTPIAVACDYGGMTQENADTFPILICEDGRYDQTGATHCERKGPAAYSISFHVGSIKGSWFWQSHFEMRQRTKARNHWEMK